MTSDQQNGVRLSPRQRRLWSLEKRAVGSPYRVVAVVALRGTVDPGRLTRALRSLVEKYEILRTTFRRPSDSPAPIQIIAPEASFEVQEHDIGHLAPDARGATVEEHTREARRTPLDTTHGPLLKITRLELSPRDHRLLIVGHALCLDRASLERLVAELSAFYGKDAEDVGIRESIQYADVAEWHNELLESEDAVPGLAFWQRRDPRIASSPDLPGQKAIAEAPFDPDCVRRPLDSALVKRIEAFAMQHGVPAPDVLLAAWIVLLRRLGGQSTVTVGVGADGRRLEELREAFGPLKGYLPLGQEVPETARFVEILDQVRTERRDLEQWQECFQWPPSPAGGDIRSSFLPFCFDYHHRPPSSCEESDLHFEIVELFECGERFCCRLACEGSANAVITVFYYDRAIFPEPVVARLAGQYQTLLESSLERPRAEIADLPILSQVERRRLLTEFNDTAADFPRGTCAHELIEQQAELDPDRTALICDGGNLTYGELETRANKLAHHLLAKGVGPDTLVALCMERSPELVISMLAVLKAGGAYVPVDPAYPPERVAFLLGDTRAPVVLTQERLAGSLPPTDAQIVRLDWERLEIERHPSERPARRATPQNLVYVIYTSGSTGNPKGVVITHEKLVISNSARIAYFGHTPKKFLLLSSFAFDSSVVGIFWTLCGGGSLILISEDVQQNLPLLAERIAEHQVTHLLTLPSFYGLILQHARPEQLACLRTVIVAGEACPKKMVDRHRSLLPGVGLFSEYGATETTVFSSVYDCLSQTLPIAPVGSPIDNAEMYILDQRLQPVPIGVTGEVHFGGAALALGYLNRPQLTAERFIPHPFSDEPGERLYKSGDLARHLECGDVEFLGRLDNQVKIRGYRVELEEIEIALVGHPAVEEAVVLAPGELADERRLVGYVVSEAGARPSLRELRTFIKETLPAYMVPAVFVFLDDMPRTPNGKIDRKALPEPGTERPELEGNFAPACSETETLLAKIFAQVLGLEQVGVNDNFFELGGDSILAIQIISRARQAGLQLTPRQMFEHQSVAELALATGDEKGPATAAEQNAVVGSVPLTPVQRWFFELDVPDPHHWNMPMILEAVRPLEVPTLERAVHALLAHHDALRLRFRPCESGWRQEIAEPGGPLPVTLVDLTDLPEEAQEEALASQAGQLQTTLDLEEGPILRTVLFERGRDRPQVLLLIAHHLAVDGLSWRIILEDLQIALEQAERGEAPQLPPKTTSFKQWAGLLQEYAGSAELQAELPTWLAVGPAPAPLPLDHPDGENLVGTVATVTVSLDAKETRELLTEVPKAYNTQINDVLIAALVHGFAAWTGDSSLLLNLEGHGREDVVEGVDLSRTVGWFTTDFPIRLSEPEPFEPGAAIEATKEQLRRIPNHGIGFGVLRHLGTNSVIAERLRQLPSPVVAFNYLGQFDQVFTRDARFRLSRQHCGPSFDPTGHRAFVLEVYGAVYDGCLEMEWEYSEALHEHSTVEGLARDFLATLRTLIGHCLSPEAGSFTPSDFADFEWDQGDLAGIARAIEKTRSPVSEDS